MEKAGELHPHGKSNFMAEINHDDGQQRAGGKVRAKKQSTKIDMTPMVDLAFLLLTFFILTATFKKARALEVLMPDKVEDITKLPPVSARNILNLVLAEDNRVYWWMGLDPPVEVSNFSSTGVRKVLLSKSKENGELMVLIKVKDEAKYENVVDILDEMKIADIRRYAIVDFTEDDNIMILRGRELIIKE